MSEKYEAVKRYYDMGVWRVERVRQAVAKGWISAIEYAQITNEEYVE